VIAVAFAVPRESAAFRERASALDAGVLHTGIGGEIAGPWLEGWLRVERPEFVISSGFAGGLDPALEFGSIVAATNFSDAALLRQARNRIPKCRSGDFVSAPAAVESVEEKRALHAKTGAIAVDMETESLAVVCAKFGVPMLALRVVSDDVRTALPLPLSVCFDLQKQRPRPLSILGVLTREPGKIGPFVRFVRSTKTAGAILADALAALLSGSDY